MLKTTFDTEKRAHPPAMAPRSHLNVKDSIREVRLSQTSVQYGIIPMPSAMPIVRSPFTAIKGRCLYCAGSWATVAECEASDCTLYVFRKQMRAEIRKAVKTGGSEGRDALLKLKGVSQTGTRQNKSTAFLPAIRKHCLWCCNGSSREVELCIEGDCPLHRYRFGRQPESAIKRPRSPAQIEAARCLAERSAARRQAKKEAAK